MTFEIQFIVHLNEHSGLQSLFPDALVDTYHRHFDDVRRGALNGRIDGIPFRHAPDDGVSGIDVAQIPPSAHDGFHILFFPGFFHCLFHVSFDARIEFEIAVNQFLALLPADVQPFRQSPGGNAVNDAEIGGG